MEHTMKEQLHHHPQLFRELLDATSERLSIPIYLVEKDYYISLVLRALSKSSYRDSIVFKGGTSLSKAYHLIDRFSEDVDFSVISKDMTGNQIKTLLSHLMKEVTTDLMEIPDFRDVSKGSKFRKQAFSYPSLLQLEHNASATLARVIVEISAFANPFPHEVRSIEPLVTTFLKMSGMDTFIAQYGLDSFELNVLSLEQTLCEKLVSLIRFSMADDDMAALSSKIRHFYDLAALLQIEHIKLYVQREEFVLDMERLIHHDQQAFDEPEGWKGLGNIADVPIISNFSEMWRERLATAYERNLSLVAYKPIPSRGQIETVFSSLIEHVRRIDLSRPLSR